MNLIAVDKTDLFVFAWIYFFLKKKQKYKYNFKYVKSFVGKMSFNPFDPFVTFILENYETKESRGYHLLSLTTLQPLMLNCNP